MLGQAEIFYYINKEDWWASDCGGRRKKTPDMELWGNRSGEQGGKRKAARAKGLPCHQGCGHTWEHVWFALGALPVFLPTIGLASMTPCHRGASRPLAFASQEGPVSMLRSVASMTPLRAGLRLSHPAGGKGGVTPEDLAAQNSLSLLECQLYPCPCPCPWPCPNSLERASVLVL